MSPGAHRLGAAAPPHRNHRDALAVRPRGCRGGREDGGRPRGPGLLRPEPAPAPGPPPELARSLRRPDPPGRHSAGRRRRTGLLELDAAELSARGVRTVVVKDGANGAWAVEGDTVERTPARQVPTVDPVGAGDAFAAGWISAALRDLTLRQRLCEAAVVASCAVAARGDITGLPDSSTRDRLCGSHQNVLR
ncbi:carbohydrate kinase family protein [Embleya sp. NPDC050154]|uniref:carbohydrate kinase family protein n=1 Tax=Embleya sp. NPDC050154 TaxID=3363988 RepID=UPI0037AFDC0C